MSSRPPAHVVRAQMPFVQQNEKSILASAAALARGALRPVPGRHVLQRTLPSVVAARRRTAALERRQCRPTRSSAAQELSSPPPAFEPMEIEEYGVDEEPAGSPYSTTSTPATPAPFAQPVTGSGLSLDESALAPATRLPYTRAGAKKAAARHVHQSQGRWYYASEDTYVSASKEDKAMFDHVGLIMETELGEQLADDDACTHCQDSGHQCWVYKRTAKDVIKHVTTVCARCRLAKAGCSKSQRVVKPKAKTQPDGPLRPLASK